MKLKFFISSALLLVWTVSVHAQTATELIAKLEQLYTSSNGISIGFTSNGNKVTMLLGKEAGSYKITTNSEQFISDGKTIWHTFDAEKKVLIDNARKSQVNAASLLDFSDNYNAMLANSTTTKSTLRLTPHSNIAPIFENAGKITSIDFTFTKNKKGLQLTSIVANCSSGEMKLAKLTIKSLKTEPSFSYLAPSTYAITDLRD